MRLRTSVALAVVGIACSISGPARAQVPYRVRDIWEVPPIPTASDPRWLTPVGSELYFVAYESHASYELWKTDGTSEGTTLVKDILPGDQSTSAPFGLSVLNGTLYFIANDGKVGDEIWRTDGTAAGTVMVKDIRPGPLSGWQTSFREAGGLLYLGADDGTNGTELWALPIGVPDTPQPVVTAMPLVRRSPR